MNFSVCVDALYMNKDFRESVVSIKKAGYHKIEFWSWWDKDLDLIAKTLEEGQLKLTTFCTKFISLVDETKRSDYINGLRESISVAKKLNCNMLISQVGQELPGISREAQKQSLIAGLKASVPILEEENITLVIEPLNTLVDHPGYFLSESKEAFAIIKEVASKHVKVLYDIYHQQITEGNILSNIQNNIEFIGHFHAAGNPGRHELDTGELNYDIIVDIIEKTTYIGDIGLEYFPENNPTYGLEKLRQ